MELTKPNPCKIAYRFTADFVLERTAKMPSPERIKADQWLVVDHSEERSIGNALIEWCDNRNRNMAYYKIMRAVVAADQLEYLLQAHLWIGTPEASPYQVIQNGQASFNRVVETCNRQRPPNSRSCFTAQEAKQ